MYKQEATRFGLFRDGTSPEMSFHAVCCAPFESLLSANLRSERNCAKASSRLLISGLAADWKQKRKECVRCAKAHDVDETVAFFRLLKSEFCDQPRKRLKMKFSFTEKTKTENRMRFRRGSSRCSNEYILPPRVHLIFLQ